MTAHSDERAREDAEADAIAAALPGNPDIAAPSGNADIARLTVGLIPKAVAALSRLQDRSGMSKTDITNRALTLYDYIESRLALGDDLIMRDPAGISDIIRLL